MAGKFTSTQNQRNCVDCEYSRYTVTSGVLEHVATTGFKVEMLVLVQAQAVVLPVLVTR